MDSRVRSSCPHRRRRNSQPAVRLLPGPAHSQDNSNHQGRPTEGWASGNRWDAAVFQRGHVRHENHSRTGFCAGGRETAIIPTTLPFPGIVEISPNGSELVINAGLDSPDNPIWLLPVPTGSPHPLGTISASTLAYSPNRKSIAYVQHQNDLYLANSDGSEPRKILSMANIFGVAFSPDGRLLRLDVSDPKTDFNTIWQARVDGSDAHPLLPSRWNTPPHECCGVWTPDGKYNVFVSLRNNAYNLWILPENAGWFGKRKPQPVQLTSGPLDFYSPRPSKDGKQIFVIGEQDRAELVRYDAKSGASSPHICQESPSATWTSRAMASG